MASNRPGPVPGWATDRHRRGPHPCRSRFPCPTHRDRCRRRAMIRTPGPRSRRDPASRSLRPADPSRAGRSRPRACPTAESHPGRVGRARIGRLPPDRPLAGQPMQRSETSLAPSGRLPMCRRIRCRSRRSSDEPRPVPRLGLAPPPAAALPELVGQTNSSGDPPSPGPTFITPLPPAAPHAVPAQIDLGQCGSASCRRRTIADPRRCGRPTRLPGPGRALAVRCRDSRPSPGRRPRAGREESLVAVRSPPGQVCESRRPIARRRSGSAAPASPAAFRVAAGELGRLQRHRAIPGLHVVEVGDLDREVLLDQLVTEGDSQRLEPRAGLIIRADPVRADEEDEVRDGRRTVGRLGLLDMQHLPRDRQHDRAGSRVDQAARAPSSRTTDRSVGSSPSCSCTPARWAAARSHWAPCRAAWSIPIAGSP